MDDIRPWPKPPRCRGIPLDDGHYTGCAYGYGDMTPYTGPCDCPSCNGSGIEGAGGVILAHSHFGNPGCCGCLFPVLRGDTADIVCNECAAIVKTVAAAGIKRTLDEMELSLNVAIEICTKCGAVNLFPGFSNMLAFTCRQCGEGVQAAGSATAD